MNPPIAPATEDFALDERQQAIFNSLKVVTFFITTVCNARCETCFYWQHLNDPDANNLTLDEITRIARGMPNFPHLLISGGEPIMRKEMPEIVDIFVREAGVQTLDMPTNGLLGRKVVEGVERLLDLHPQLLITVGLSLDGFEETHDRLRAVPGNFQKLWQTLDALNEMRYRRVKAAEAGEGPYPMLRVLTLTCVNNQNLDEVEALADWVSANKDVDGMMFECLRGEPKDPDLAPPSPAQFDRIIQKSMEVNSDLMGRRFPDDRPARLAYVRGVYRMQREHLVGGKIPTTCQAGVNLAVLEPDGRVRLCELLDEVGDLRQNGLDWKRVFFSEEANRQRRWITEARCSCTHCVNLGHSIDAGKNTRLQRQVDQKIFDKTRL
ncbi:radical SAM protein [bacterium]|nr:radical SAM protein [bacterium]